MSTPLDDIVREVADAVRGGGTVIFPTDTVYGIGCAPEREEAVERIFGAKRRPADKPLSLHFGDVAAMLAYVERNEWLEAAARAFLPGALTAIVTRPAHVGAFVTRGKLTVGVRVPAHPLCAALLAGAGPIAATSANLSGRPAYTGGRDVTGLPEADVFVADGPTPLRTESTIIDLTGHRPRLLREGAITRAMLEHHLGTIEDVR